ncbi:MAG: metal ABC transporter substrate-binding protein [Bacilli bacterium]|nr:metal ABC transporter substrate-binding protein [Bacilli bacterium]
MKKCSLFLPLILIILFTGCFKRDNLEDITIYTTSYPIEYITNYLYKDHSTIESIYPDGVNINTYELNDKQIKDYSKSDMYIFSGLSNEKNYVTKMVDNNSDLMILDATQTMEYTNSIEELWLDPSNFLMLALNIKNGLLEYITNHYLKTDIEARYEQLKVSVSNIDAELKLLSEIADNTTIITDNDVLKFLEKYGFTVISLDEDTLTDKTKSEAVIALNNAVNKYIYTIDQDNLSQTVNDVVKKTKAGIIEIQTISNLTEEQRSNNEDYITILNDNIEALKSTLYN